MQPQADILCFLERPSGAVAELSAFTGDNGIIPVRELSYDLALRPFHIMVYRIPGALRIRLPFRDKGDEPRYGGNDAPPGKRCTGSVVFGTSQVPIGIDRKGQACRMRPCRSFVYGPAVLHDEPIRRNGILNEYPRVDHGKIPARLRNRQRRCIGWHLKIRGIYGGIDSGTVLPLLIDARHIKIRAGCFVVPVMHLSPYGIDILTGDFAFGQSSREQKRYR